MKQMRHLYCQKYRITRPNRDFLSMQRGQTFLAWSGYMVPHFGQHSCLFLPKISSSESSSDFLIFSKFLLARSTSPMRELENAHRKISSPFTTAIKEPPLTARIISSFSTSFRESFFISGSVGSPSANSFPA